MLSFNLSPTKKMILEIIQDGNVAVENIAVTVGISKGMTYNHLRELKTMGYVSDEGGYSLTDSGRLAVI
jgi:CRISPR-associated protein Csa3